MVLFAMCMECHKEYGHPSFEPFLVPYFEERILEFTCSRGHKNVQVIQSQKFEVLLESGANALLAGFTLEASASFSAALERLYEFAFKVLSRACGVENNIYEKMFKVMAKQSERQLGGFLALYLIKFGTPYIPQTSIIEFRNSVIHKGFIPKPEKAKEFCSKVYDEIFEITKKLKSRYSEALQKTLFDDLEERFQKIDPKISRSTGTGCLFFSLSRKDNKINFHEALEALKNEQKIIEDAMPSLREMFEKVKSGTKYQPVAEIEGPEELIDEILNNLRGGNQGNGKIKEES